MAELIIGGTSGLGLEIARISAADGNEVIVTGRHDPGVDFAEYRELHLTGPDLAPRIGQFVMGLPHIDSLVYAAGFYQEGHITDLSDEQVDAMIDVGGRGLIFFVKKLLEKQGSLDELVTVTSTSQAVPREYEPVYNFVKAGAGHYSHGQSLDPSIGRTLVVAPAGMDTPFFSDGRDMSTMLDPAWVAKAADNIRHMDNEYVYAKILREPPRVEIVEQY